MIERADWDEESRCVFMCLVKSNIMEIFITHYELKPRLRNELCIYRLKTLSFGSNKLVSRPYRRLANTLMT